LEKDWRKNAQELQNDLPRERPNVLTIGYQSEVKNLCKELVDINIGKNIKMLNS